MKRFFLSFLPAIGWVILSTVLLTLPGSVLPKEGWLDAIWFDKWVHIGMFSIMAYLLCRGVYEKKLSYFIICGLACLCYGIAMEFVQRDFVTNRTFDVTDIIADGVGSLIGVLYSARTYIKK